MDAPLITLFGGSFDPIHHGHLTMASIILKEINNTEIYFIPCGNPVHREASKTPAEDRLAMIKLAIEHEPNYNISTFEIDSREPSYTINTLRYFRKKFSKNPLGFIMGMDTFISLDKAWGENWRDILQYTHLFIFPRMNYNPAYSPTLQEFLTLHLLSKTQVHQYTHGGIVLLDERPPPVSSTEIRQKLTLDEDVSTLLPKIVYNHLLKKRDTK